MAKQMKPYKENKFQEQANLTVLKLLVDTGSSCTTFYDVVRHCCGAKKKMSHAQVRKAIRNGTNTCRECFYNRGRSVSEEEMKFKCLHTSAGSKYPLTGARFHVPDWPVPPSVRSLRHWVWGDRGC